MLSEKKKIEVVAAIIQHENKVLCVQRGENKLSYISKKYEFPGGKVESGETLQETIIREIQEELKIKVVPIQQFITVDHEYPDFNLKMHSFICECENVKIVLTEHIQYKWLKTNELIGLDWAEADIPIVNKLVESND